MKKTINICLDAYNEVRCGTSYDEWCDDCPYNNKRKIAIIIISEADDESKNN